MKFYKSIRYNAIFVIIKSVIINFNCNMFLTLIMFFIIVIYIIYYINT